MAPNVNQGFFSVIRWRSDATRDEARNVAVLLVDAEGGFGSLRAAPISAISPRLHEQGMLDAMLAGLGARFAQEVKPTLAEIKDLHASLQRSIYLTEPQPVAVPDIDSAMNALYRAYVAPHYRSSKEMTKGRVLDTVVETLRKSGHPVRRGEYVKDFIFDLVIDGGNRSVGEVLSFATSAKNWTPVEHAAGHFLYANARVGADAFAVIEPPSDVSHQNASVAHDRVLRWFVSEQVRVLRPDELRQASLSL